MFEKIVLRRSEDGQLPTLGDLAEALLFYQHVHLILDRASVISFATSIGMEQLIALLRRKNVSAIYCRDQLGTQTQQFGALAHHNFIAFELTGKQDKPNRFTARDALEESIKGIKKYSSRMARKLTDQFLEIIPVKALAGGDFLGGKATGLVEAATADVYDLPYLTEAISRCLSLTPGFTGLPVPLAIEVQPTHAGFTVFSNLDLKKTNEARARLSPPLDPLTVAHLLTEIVTARSDMLIAAHYGSDFRTSLTGSSLLALRYEVLLRRSAIHTNEMKQFQQVIVNEGRSLKEVVDSGERSFDEFLTLLDKARVFRHWADGIHPDASMIAEYLKETSREGWIGSLPGKALRFVIGGALDLGVPGSGTVFGLADALLVDKMAKGWRPNHFVSSRLKLFVNC